MNGAAEQPPPLPGWLVYMLADTSLLQAVFWIVAIGGLIAVIIKLWPALKNLVSIIDSVAGLPAFIKRTDDSIVAVRRQIENDHEAEPVMREEITTAKESAAAAHETATRIERKFDEVIAWQENHERDSANALERIEALENNEEHH